MAAYSCEGTSMERHDGCQHCIDCLWYALSTRGVWSLSLPRTTVETWNFKREEDFKMDEILHITLCLTMSLNICESLSRNSPRPKRCMMMTNHKRSDILAAQVVLSFLFLLVHLSCCIFYFVVWLKIQYVSWHSLLCCVNKRPKVFLQFNKKTRFSHHPCFIAHKL